MNIYTIVKHFPGSNENEARRKRRKEEEEEEERLSVLSMALKTPRFDL